MPISEELTKHSGPDRVVRAGCAPGHVEAQLCQIWEEVLVRKGIGVEDDFFDLGGESVQATQIITRIQQVFDVELTLLKFYETATIGSLARAVGEQEPETRCGVESGKRPKKLPLSYGQERLWFLSHLGYSGQYHVPQVMRIRGKLDEAALQQALKWITDRHESLRTSFREEEGSVVQQIAGRMQVAIEKRDISRRNEEEREAEAAVLLQEWRSRSFDLEQPYLWRVLLVRIAEEEHILGWCLHHIICDGKSLSILKRDLEEGYQAYRSGREPQWKPMEVQYADYAVWQRSELRVQQLEEGLKYWQDSLAGYEDLELGMEGIRGGEEGTRLAGRVRVTVSGEEGQVLRKACQARQKTLYTLLMGSVYLVLSGYSGQEDICIGMPVANRKEREIEEVVGFFVNTVVLRLRGNGRASGEGWLKEVQAKIAQAQEWEHVPFEKVVERMHPQRELGRNPIVQVAVNYVDRGKKHWKLGEADVEEEDSGNWGTKFDVLFDMRDREDGGVELELVYNEELYEGSEMERMGKHVLGIMKQLVWEPERAVEELQLLGAAERQQLLVGWNHTQRKWAGANAVHELFEEQAKTTPAALAVVHKQEQLSYANLNRRANQLAHYLRRRGVGPEVRVGVCLERGLELVWVLLAVLKAGGAYVPLDPEYPQQRLAYMLQDSNARLVITQQGLRQKLRLEGSEALAVVTLEELQAELSHESDKNPAPWAKGQNLAYVIYTSGSTGQPKAVAIEHRSTVTMLHWAREVFTSEELSGVLASTSVCFDLSVFEIFVPLSWGGKVVMARNVLELNEVAGCHEVRLVNTVPSAMAELLRGGGLPAAVRTINLAGELLSEGLVEEVYKQKQVERVWDLYGPSEDTTYSTYTLRQVGEAANIGQPIANTQVYVLNKRMELVPVGVRGELYIGGSGLARGYLQRPDLTAEKFVPNVFCGRPGGERLYKTGDVVRWWQDGKLEYLGRVDHQVKIRGFRIECGEIETAVKGYPGIEGCVVLPRNEAGEKKLIAFLVCSVAGFEIAQLREYLQGRLPGYMIPSRIARLDKLPLMPNGKIDRSNLLKLDLQPERKAHAVSPRTPLEHQLSQIWSEVLDVENISIHDDFFELGGHSLMAMRIRSRVNKNLRTDVSLREFFRLPTISGMASVLNRANELEQGEI